MAEKMLDPQRVKDLTRRRTVTADLGREGVEELDQCVALLQNGTRSGRRVTRSSTLRKAVRCLLLTLEGQLSDAAWAQLHPGETRPE